jgi:hypothetical protein
VYAGVFPALVVGDYTLLGIAEHPTVDLTVTSGAVTEIDW